MFEVVIQLIWLSLYHYYTGQISELEQGVGKRIMVWVITLTAVLSVQTYSFFPCWGGPGYRLAGWFVTLLVFLLYVLFYDAKPFGRQWWKILVPGVAFLFGAMIVSLPLMVFWNSVIMVILLLLLGYERGYLQIWQSFLNVILYLSLDFLLWGFGGESMGVLAGILVELLLFFSLEGTLFSYHRGFETRTEHFQREILSRQYEEVREIYLNMRSWRHDYHNHLQAIKAQLAAGQLEETRLYLDALEQNLNKVDTYVKSGNLMADAILNSKLTLAEQRMIRVNCKVVLPEKISVEDVDLCVLLGNLLDNALEACEKISEGCRFLRIYMVANGQQLYLSIQNSAKEELDFDERNYISRKRGNHGLGMKRVKVLVDKYDGYLNLANEPGIFAAEVTLPL